MDGDKVWIGSRGWVAQADLPSRRIERVAWLAASTNRVVLDPTEAARVGTIQVSGSEVWIGAGKQLCRVPRK